MSVVVDSGYVQAGFGLARKTVTGGTLTVATADATYPRLDVVYVDATGAIGIYAGTPTAISPSSKTDFKEMATPAPGTNIPSGIILSLVYVAAGATSILNASINDIATYGPYVVESPTTTTSGKVPYWSSSAKTLSDGYTVGTSANNLLQLDSSGKIALVNITSGGAGQAIIQGASAPAWTTRSFDVAFPFGDGSIVLTTGSQEYRIPIACKIVAARIWEVGLISSSITCTLYKHAIGVAAGSVVDTFSLSSTTYSEETGLSISVSAGDILRIETSSITAAKQIVCSLSLEPV